MRSQLASLETYGGALLRPAFVDFPDWNLAEDPAIVLFGEDLLVLFNFEGGDWNRKVDYFPTEHDWVSFTTFETYLGSVRGPYTFDTTTKTVIF
jgi:hypothetical protein